MSVNIVTPWYINKVKNVLFHCYLLFQVNITDFTISNALRLSHSSLENATGRPTAGDFFSPFVYACISCFFSCSYDICPVKSVLFGRKFWKFRKDITGLWCHLKVMRFIRNTCGCPTLLSLFLKLTIIHKYAIFPLYLQQSQ